MFDAKFIHNVAINPYFMCSNPLNPDKDDGARKSRIPQSEGQEYRDRRIVGYTGVIIHSWSIQRYRGDTIKETIPSFFKEINKKSVFFITTIFGKNAVNFYFISNM